jgi:hypothetical protein
MARNTVALFDHLFQKLKSAYGNNTNECAADMFVALK